ncbi:ADP-ribose pyrophosphatase [Bacillus sp. AFS018417]|uniref:NUDIX hydrolase n=1 Tax=unclassified Bacillus (in: firmicutes) TaxID=185979 RepID=UPI000BF40CDB|nr:MULTISPECIES: NUDIX hydrolase [unclassified Bacillus (in: firmicutes)]MCP1123701.1 NUDIX hydrolase [Bacillus sp. 3103sda1]PEZ08156.1 ADP-ribose pyrophosphatase [Bacillus sp. AFS018417]
MPYPKHIVTAATVVLNDKNEILLLKSPMRGWEIPGGQVEEGEAIPVGAIREAKEETGIDIEIIKYCGVYQNVSQCICNHLFLGKPVGGQFTTSSESLEVGYFSIEEALQMVTWTNFKERILYCLDEKKQPFLVAF